MDAQRHLKMTENVNLEKYKLGERRDYLADKTFGKGQNILKQIIGKHQTAEERKTMSIEKVKRQHAQHIEQVMSIMEQSFIDEESRKIKAMEKTGGDKLNFLQRLENQQRERSEDHKVKFDSVNKRHSEVKDRQVIDKKQRDRRRFTVEKKSQLQDSQVKLAKDRSQSYIELHAEKRKILRENNVETNNILKLKKFDKDAMKLHNYEQKNQKFSEFQQQIVEAKNVTSTSALETL